MKENGNMMYYVKVKNAYVSNTVRDGSYLTVYKTYASIYTYEDALRLMTVYANSYLEPITKG